MTIIGHEHVTDYQHHGTRRWESKQGPTARSQGWPNCRTLTTLNIGGKGGDQDTHLPVVSQPLVHCSCVVSWKWTFSYCVSPRLLALVSTQGDLKTHTALKPVQHPKHWSVEATVKLPRNRRDGSLNHGTSGKGNSRWHGETLNTWPYAAKWKMPVWKAIRAWF